MQNKIIDFYKKNLLTFEQSIHLQYKDIVISEL